MLNRVLGIILFVLSAVALTVSVYVLCRGSNDQNLERTLKKEATIRGTDTGKAMSCGKLAAENGKSELLSSGEENLWLAEKLRIAAVGSKNSAEKIECFCLSLREISRAIAKKPSDAKALTSWANIRQILGAHDCGLEGTQGSYNEALSTALRLAPSNINVKYSAGLIYLWGNQPELANRLFGEVLTYGTKLDTPKEELIFSQIKDSRGMEEILPPRFPQILKYSKWYFQEGKGVLISSEIKESLAKSQLNAIKESRQAEDEGIIPSETHYYRMVNIEPFAASDTVRQVIDVELARILEQKGWKEIADYFVGRSHWMMFPVVASSEYGDTRPGKTSLSDWGREEKYYFDDFFHTTGAYVPSDSKASLIEISGRCEDCQVQSQFIKILGSDDNRSWMDITESSVVRVIDLEGRVIIGAILKERKWKFLKVHYGSSRKAKSFLVENKGDLRVYGTSTRVQ